MTRVKNGWHRWFGIHVIDDLLVSEGWQRLTMVHSAWSWLRIDNNALTNPWQQNFSSQGSIASITVLPLSRQATVQIVSMLLRTKFLGRQQGTLLQVAGFNPTALCSTRSRRENVENTGLVHGPHVGVPKHYPKPWSNAQLWVGTAGREHSWLCWSTPSWWPHNRTCNPLLGDEQRLIDGCLMANLIWLTTIDEQPLAKH